MAIRIPLTSAQPAYLETVEIDGTTYRLNVVWNTRTEAWYLDFLEANETAIILGQKLTSGWLPWARFADSRLPQGAVAVVDTIAQNQKPGREELGVSATLVFATQAELDAA